MVEAEHSTESLTSANGLISRSEILLWLDQSIGQALMIALLMIVNDEFGHRTTQPAVPHENYPIQALFFD